MDCSHISVRSASACWPYHTLLKYDLMLSSCLHRNTCSHRPRQMLPRHGLSSFRSLPSPTASMAFSATRKQASALRHSACASCCRNFCASFGAASASTVYQTEHGIRSVLRLGSNSPITTPTHATLADSEFGMLPPYSQRVNSIILVAIIHPGSRMSRIEGAAYVMTHPGQL